MLHKIIAVYIIDVILAINHLSCTEVICIIVKFNKSQIISSYTRVFYEKKLVHYQFPLTLLTTGYISTTKNNFLPKETLKSSPMVV